METPEIKHDPSRNGFFLPLDGKEAELTYRTDSRGVLVYHHTFVPPPMRGRGIAGRITRHALDWAREQGYKVKATCPFVVAFLKKHREYDDIVASSSS